ncbi:uncharacterized protein [Euwallacea similis]|uniref:uncharacterized protein n=1 Tax=Euwallacea similis TaxID=1736056 RepID=UPI00344D4845
MSINLKPLDSFKLTGRLTTNFACDFSGDDRICIVSDVGVYIVTQKPNLNSNMPQYSCEKSFIPPSSYTLCEHLDIDINLFFHELPKDVLYEVLGRVELSQNLRCATPSNATVIHAQWSECNMVDGAFSMLGLLTSLYSLDIYVWSIWETDLSKYKLVLNLTKCVLEKKQPDFIYSNRLPPLQKIRELRKRVELISPLTFTWGHTFSCNNVNYTVIFLGHFNGDISIWKIRSMKSTDPEANCEFLCSYSSKLTHISSMYWHKISNYTGVLCLGDTDGKISVLKVNNLENSECYLEEEVVFYSKTDIKVDKITIMIIKDYTILIAVKQSFLLLYGIDLAGSVFDLIAHNVGNYYITGVECIEDKIRVLTFTGILKELHVSVHFKKINIDEKSVPIKFNFSGYRTHGQIASANKVLYGFLLSPYKHKNSFKGKTFVNFQLFHDSNLDPLKLLMDNNSGSLRHFWDCFEALRLICLKDQRFPYLGLNPDIDLDTCSLIELKTIRLIAKISETVFTTMVRVVTYEIKPYILVHYLVDIKMILQRLSLLFKEKRQLSVFEMRSVHLQVFFLKELVMSGVLAKSQVGKNFIGEISHILAIANELEYPDVEECLFCGEKLLGYMCLPPHKDSRCVFTLMPILAPVYKCILCNSVAHNDIEKKLNSIVCPYCDYPMHRISFNSGENIENKESGPTFMCASDCIQDSKEVIEELLLNVETSDIDVLTVSDSEQEDKDSENIKELYFRLGKVNFDCDLDMSKLLKADNE